MEEKEGIVAKPTTDIVPNEVVSSTPIPTVPINTATPTVQERFVSYFNTHTYLMTSIAALVAIAILGLALHERQEAVAIKKYSTVFAFVPEKISQSATIPVKVPNGVSDAVAQASISFSPEVKGTWTTDTEEGMIYFDPADPLKTGTYYAVNLKADALEMSGDFYVDEDPKVLAILPATEGESHEDTEITILFNRPMVPLTTLSEQELKEIPITITPETPGHFKWISTRNLQFIPETTLIPSSSYTVDIGEGLTSVDGLAVAPTTHTFTTRPLRYVSVSEGIVGYRSPIIVDFNQSVDLEKTAEAVMVRNAAGDTVPVNVTYGEQTRYDTKLKKSVTEVDRSKVFVRAKADRHGRKNVWDFETAYEFSIEGAVPLAGNQNLAEVRQQRIAVPSVVAGVRAESDRTSLARPDFLDPQGTLVLTFFENIDKDQSRMYATGLRSVAYADRCKVDQNNETIMLGSECEKEPDTRTLIFSFDPEKIARDLSFDLNLERLMTTDGLRVNQEPIKVPLHSYPTFNILRTLPAQGASGAPLDGMYICTNAPIKDPSEQGLSSYVKASDYIVFGRWSNSQFVSEASPYYKCGAGEFETNIRYGLLPETKYTVNLTLTDVFDARASVDLSFKTEAAKESYVRFHNMQPQYNVTTPDKTTLTYATENMEYVNMNVCRMSPEAFLESTLIAMQNDLGTTPPSGVGCLEDKSVQIPLPKRYWVNNYFQIHLADYFADVRGHYVVTFSHPLLTMNAYMQSGTLRKPQYDRTYVSVTNLVVGKKEIERYEPRYESNDQSQYAQRNIVRDKNIERARNLYWVTESKSMNPVVGASVDQYAGGYNTAFTKGSVGATDPSGVARVVSDTNVAGVVVRRGTDSAIVTDWADQLQYSGAAGNASRTYVYTDRPIYRPGHTVYIRGIDRIGFDGSYEIWNKGNVNLEVRNALGETVYQVPLVMSAFGTFNTSFTLPDDAPLGTYTISGLDAYGWFDVEEYVPSAFAIDAKASKEEYVDRDTMHIDVAAEYYFGTALSEGKVSYSVTAQDYYFDRYTDEYFNFGGGWYYCYECGYGDNFLFRGETTLDEAGKATIERQLDLMSYFSSDDVVGSKLITVSITVRDINGRSVSTQKSFIVHKGDFYIGAKTDDYYTSKNTPTTLRIKTVDTQGAPLAVSNLTRTVRQINWETFKRQEVDGGFYYRSEKRFKDINSENIRTDKDGNWSGSLSFAEEGEYEIRISGKDAGGRDIETTAHMYIYGSQAVAAPPNNSYELDLEVEKTSVDVGDTATLLIKSPYEKAKVLITAERGTVYDYWIADVVGGLYKHSFPVKSSYAPNMYVAALLISPNPEVKFGSVRYDVGVKEHALDVAVSSNKTTYLPGEDVVLSVETKDNLGNPVSAEVSLAVADLSVLALKGNPKKNPLVFFYDGFPLSVSTASNLKNILYEVAIPLGTKGGGGANPDDLSKKKRGLFKDTAYWEASVITDENGKGTVKFTLPDNLTTWQIESLGVTKDTKLGVDYKEFTTKKDLMAVPLKPRFVVPGDTFSLGAQVFNQTDHATTVDVQLDSTSLEFLGDKTDAVKIAAGESKTVYFDVRAPKNKKAGEHIFTFTAKDGTFEDSVEQSISITPNTTFETVATANFTSADTATEYIYIPKEVISNEGGLTIHANATMAVFLTDALNYMVTYPYGCGEQLASALSTIATLKSALKVPNVVGSFENIEYEGVRYDVDTVVAQGLSRIYEVQTFDGGFAYYKGMEPDLFLTTHVALTLLNLQDAGYTIRDGVLDNALTYIEMHAADAYRMYPDDTHKDTVIFAEYVVRRARGTDTALTQYIKTFIADTPYIQERISSKSLTYLAILTYDSYTRSEVSKVYTALLGRIDIDGRGAYLKNPVQFESWGVSQTAITDTALLLKALVVHDDEHPMIGNILRWILAGRDKDGVWGGTHNTFVVVDAMVDYLKWQHESESEFSLRGLLDGAEIFVHNFTPKNIWETFTHVISIDSFEREKLLPLTFERTKRNEQKNNFYYDMALKYFLPVESLPPRDEGITITRDLYAYDAANTKNSTPVSSAQVGDIVRGKITLSIPGVYSHIAVEDIIPAGFEIVNFNLNTEDQSLQNQDGEYGEGQKGYDNDAMGYVVPPDNMFIRAFDRIESTFTSPQTAQIFGAIRDLGGEYKKVARKLWPSHVESHDDRVFLYIDTLSPGVYEYEYFLRALVPGTFQHMPARAEELYFPEVFGRTEGATFTITE